MGRPSRDKGASGELEVLELVHAAGWPRATRNFASGARGNSDIANGPAHTLIEVKRVERFALRAAWAQVSADADQAGPGWMPVIAHRWNRGPWLAIVELPDLLDLIAIQERA
jgi:hypothetical protein